MKFQIITREVVINFSLQIPNLGFLLKDQTVETCPFRETTKKGSDRKLWEKTEGEIRNLKIKRTYTLATFNMEPENDGSQKESPIPWCHFSGSILNFGRVTFLVPWFDPNCSYSITFWKDHDYDIMFTLPKCTFLENNKASKLKKVKGRLKHRWLR